MDPSERFIDPRYADPFFREGPTSSGSSRPAPAPMDEDTSQNNTSVSMSTTTNGPYPHLDEPLPNPNRPSSPPAAAAAAAASGSRPLLNQLPDSSWKASLMDTSIYETHGPPAPLHDDYDDQPAQLQGYEWEDREGGGAPERPQGLFSPSNLVNSARGVVAGAIGMGKSAWNRLSGGSSAKEETGDELMMDSHRPLEMPRNAYEPLNYGPPSGAPEAAAAAAAASATSSGWPGSSGQGMGLLNGTEQSSRQEPAAGLGIGTSTSPHILELPRPYRRRTSRVTRYVYEHLWRGRDVPKYTYKYDMRTGERWCERDPNWPLTRNEGPQRYLDQQRLRVHIEAYRAGLPRPAIPDGLLGCSKSIQTDVQIPPSDILPPGHPLAPPTPLISSNPSRRTSKESGPAASVSSPAAAAAAAAGGGYSYSSSLTSGQSSGMGYHRPPYAAAAEVIPNGVGTAAGIGMGGSGGAGVLSPDPLAIKGSGRRGHSLGLFSGLRADQGGLGGLEKRAMADRPTDEEDDRRKQSRHTTDVTDSVFARIGTPDFGRDRVDEEPPAAAAAAAAAAGPGASEPPPWRPGMTPVPRPIDGFIGSTHSRTQGLSTMELMRRHGRSRRFNNDNALDYLYKKRRELEARARQEREKREKEVEEARRKEAEEIRRRIIQEEARKAEESRQRPPPLGMSHTDPHLASPTAHSPDDDRPSPPTPTFGSSPTRPLSQDSSPAEPPPAAAAAAAAAARVVQQPSVEPQPSLFTTSPPGSQQQHVFIAPPSGGGMALFHMNKTGEGSLFATGAAAASDSDQMVDAANDKKRRAEGAAHEAGRATKEKKPDTGVAPRPLPTLLPTFGTTTEVQQQREGGNEEAAGARPATGGAFPGLRPGEPGQGVAAAAAAAAGGDQKDPSISVSTGAAAAPAQAPAPAPAPTAPAQDAGGVPWWLANVGKPNMVGVDEGEGVFADDDQEEAQDGQPRANGVPAAAAAADEGPLLTSNGTALPYTPLLGTGSLFGTYSTLSSMTSDSALPSTSGGALFAGATFGSVNGTTTAAPEDVRANGLPARNDLPLSSLLGPSSSVNIFATPPPNAGAAEATSSLFTFGGTAAAPSTGAAPSAASDAAKPRVSVFNRLSEGQAPAVTLTPASTASLFATTAPAATTAQTQPGAGGLFAPATAPAPSASQSTTTPATSLFAPAKAPSSGTGGGLFGAAVAEAASAAAGAASGSGSLFRGDASTGSLFGGGAGTSSGGSGLFGGGAAAPGTGGSIFGQTAGSLFGGTSGTGAGTSSGGSIFRTSGVAGSSLFGGSSASTGGSLFGGGAFGQQTAGGAAQQSSIFSQPQQPQAPFGSANPFGQPPSGGAFGGGLTQAQVSGSGAASQSAFGGGLGAAAASGTAFSSGALTPAPKQERKKLRVKRPQKG